MWERGKEEKTFCHVCSFVALAPCTNKSILPAALIWDACYRQFQHPRSTGVQQLSGCGGLPMSSVLGRAPNNAQLVVSSPWPSLHWYVSSVAPLNQPLDQTFPAKLDGSFVIKRSSPCVVSVVQNLHKSIINHCQCSSPRSCGRGDMHSSLNYSVLQQQMLPWLK